MPKAKPKPKAARRVVAKAAKAAKASVGTAPEPPERPACACGCGADAEIEFAGLFYTKACFQKEIDGLRAVGIPIEQSEKGFRLRPGTRVVFVDDGDPTKVH